MRNVFKEEICSVCMLNNTKDCKKNIQQEKNNIVKKAFCTEYIKDSSKIVPYEAPIFVTAKRDYVDFYER